MTLLGVKSAFLAEAPRTIQHSSAHFITMRRAWSALNHCCQFRTFSGHHSNGILYMYYVFLCLMDSITKLSRIY
jgi:hypothetical protein